MALAQKQKDIRDKKVEELSIKINDKQAQINRNIAQHAELISKLQAEKDEAELLKQALEALK